MASSLLHFRCGEDYVQLDYSGHVSILTNGGGEDGIAGRRREPPAHRRQADERQPRHFSHDQSGHRRSAGCGSRCRRRGHGSRDRGGPTCLRRHGLVAQHRAAGAVHSAAARRDARARRRTTRDHHRRSRRATDADRRRPIGRTGRRSELRGRHRRQLPVELRSRRRVADGNPHPAHRCARGRRRGRRDHPVELPAPDQLGQAGARTRRRKHHCAEAGAGHAVVRGGAR